jgi:hypothetical protein
VDCVRRKNGLYSLEIKRIIIKWFRHMVCAKKNVQATKSLTPNVQVTTANGSMETVTASAPSAVAEISKHVAAARAAALRAAVNDAVSCCHGQATVTPADSSGRVGLVKQADTTKPAEHIEPAEPSKLAEPGPLVSTTQQRIALNVAAYTVRHYPHVPAGDCKTAIERELTFRMVRYLNSQQAQAVRQQYPLIFPMHPLLRYADTVDPVVESPILSRRDGRVVRKSRYVIDLNQQSGKRVAFQIAVNGAWQNGILDVDRTRAQLDVLPPGFVEPLLMTTAVAFSVVHERTMLGEGAKMEALKLSPSCPPAPVTALSLLQGMNRPAAATSIGPKPQRMTHLRADGDASASRVASMPVPFPASVEASAPKRKPANRPMGRPRQQPKAKRYLLDDMAVCTKAGAGAAHKVARHALAE